jgi:hypothetical protein
VMEMAIIYSFAALPRVLQTSAAQPSCRSAVVAALPLGRAARLRQGGPHIASCGEKGGGAN